MISLIMYHIKINYFVFVFLLSSPACPQNAPRFYDIVPLGLLSPNGNLRSEGVVVNENLEIVGGGLTDHYELQPMMLFEILRM